MAGATSLFVDEVLFEVLKELGLLVQLYEEFIVSDQRTVICLPSANYSRSLSFSFLNFTSDFYCAFLRNSPTLRICKLCYQEHSRNYLCLPNMFERHSLDLLFDIFEWKRRYVSFADDLVSLVRLCGYLLIKPNVVHTFLANLVAIDEVMKSENLPIFAFELYRNGFFETAAYFSQGVDHPRFYSLLKTFRSYRDVKRKLRSFKRYRNFARTCTYSSGRVRFLRIRAAFYYDFTY